MRISVIVGLIVLLCRKESEAGQAKYDYDEYYYGENYEEPGEKNADLLTAALEHNTESPSSSQIGKEFRGTVTCSSELMTLELDKTLLPRGLSFDAQSFHEKTNTRGDASSDATCVQIANNETHILYKVSMDCQNAVGELQFGSAVVYSHEALLIGATEPQGERDLYTVVMDCETVSTRSRKGVLPRQWNPEYRLFEHRKGSSCVTTSCPHGDSVCLPEGNLDGYFCTCPENAENCGCPDGFYGCARPENASALITSLVCIRNDRLCNKRFDCPLKDDELCSDVWSSWSAWSSCDSTCGKGLQIRRRSCKHMFINDPARCSKRCDIDTLESKREERGCDSGPCSSVQCDSEFMIVTVPLEFGKAVEDRVHLKYDNENECQPVVNSTHARFVVPLHRCNTSTWIDGDLVFYSNEVIYEVDRDPSSVIIREFGHSYTAKCQYKRRHTVGLRRLELNPGSEFVDVPVLAFRDELAALSAGGDRLDVIEHYTSGDGEFEFRMDIFADSSYESKYNRNDYPLQKRLGERLYVAVTFSSQDEDLHVFIERCYATASDENGINQNDTKYEFISNGCPLDPTVFFHNHDNSHFSDRYSIESFKFDDPDHWYVYFLCEVVLCEVSEDDKACHRECGKNGTAGALGRQKREARGEYPAYAHVMQGPVVVLSEDELRPQSKRSRESAGTIQHRMLTRWEVQGKSNDRSGSVQQWWKSPFAIAAVAGIICMVFGLAVGVALGRRKTAQQAV